MVLLTVRGIPVDFPYMPYGPQVVYMTRVLDALRAGNNALLESPTGTGKTLCLLCATLAWRQTFIASLQAAVRGMKGGGAAGCAAGKGGGDSPGLDSFFSREEARGAVPRIVYASRTHSQLAQAVRELKKTIYKPRMTVLGSRAQMCIHPQVSEMGEVERNYRCRALTSPKRRGCEYYLAVRSNKPHENRCEQLLQRLSTEGPRDIEDLAEFGRQERACPYYLSRAAQGECDIIFVPYNYLLDQSARDTLDVSWANDIIILDEAHNIESICVSAMSFDLSSTVRHGCQIELTSCCEKSLKPGGISFPVLEKMAAASDAGEAKVIGSENKEVLEFRILRTILMDLEEEVESLPMPENKPLVKPGAFLRDLFVRAGGATEMNHELILEAIDRSMKLIVGDETEPSTSGDGVAPVRSKAGRGTPLRTLYNAIQTLFSPQAVASPNSFRTVIHLDKSRPPQRTVSYWCFNPALGMAALSALNLRCILLTSGTLSPLQSFAGELGLSFPVQLENPHVVSEQQILGCVIKTGPGGTRLNASFKNRSSAIQTKDLGQALLNLFRVIPGGVLVFFPSYANLYSTIEAWKKVDLSQPTNSLSIWILLQRRKYIVVEPRDSSRFAAAILAHQTNVREGKGSALFAVCRGKVSEGIDFSDDYGRAVIVTGIPYPSAADPKVMLKREYMEEESKQGRTAGALNGNEWYTLQALRAVNQAMGRTIRHKNDYGAVILLDERFSSKRNLGGLSKWIRSSFKILASFSEGQAVVSRFFRDLQKSDFAISGLNPTDGGGSCSVRRGDVSLDDTRVVEARKAVVTMNRIGTSNVDVAKEMKRIASQLSNYEQKRMRVCQGSAWDLRHALGQSHSTEKDDSTVYCETQKMSVSLLANHSAQVANVGGRSSDAGKSLVKELAEIFDDKEQRRECFGKLRMMVAIAKRISSGETDKNREQRADDLRKGFEAVDRFVEIVKGAGGSTLLLRKIKVPKVFQERFDMALRREKAI